MVFLRARCKCLFCFSQDRTIFLLPKLFKLCNAHFALRSPFARECPAGFKIVKPISSNPTGMDLGCSTSSKGKLGKFQLLIILDNS